MASTSDQQPETTVRDAILAATEELLQGTTLDDLSVAQILTAAQTSRATFYFYFASKEDAFLALLAQVMRGIMRDFLAIVGDAERRRSPHLRQDIADWLTIGPPHQVVVRSAVEEWPRRPELREAYLAGHAKMAQALARAIDEDRAAGVAAEGIPSAQLAAGWIWTMERAWYEAVGGADHLGDVPAVLDALAATLVAAVYGR